jgi:hypothetical protein
VDSTIAMIRLESFRGFCLVNVTLKSPERQGEYFNGCACHELQSAAPGSHGPGMGLLLMPGAGYRAWPLAWQLAGRCEDSAFGQGTAAGAYVLGQTVIMRENSRAMTVGRGLDRRNAVMFHYTDNRGHKAISSQIDWTFRASQPPGDHDRGAYFTTLRVTDNRFSARTRIPKMKQRFVFVFRGEDGLAAKEGGRGAYMFWTPNEYVVVPSRQVYDGPTEAMP